jgi:WD40 repeat protein
MQIEWDDRTKKFAKVLTDSFLLTAATNALTGEPTVEVAHEVLIRSWPRLRAWVDQYRVFIIWYQTDFVAYFQKWKIEEKDPTLLLQSPSMLAAAGSWLTKHPELLSGEASEYIRLSLESERRRVAGEKARREIAAKQLRFKKRRNVAITVGCLVAIAVAIPWYQHHLHLLEKERTEKQQTDLRRQMESDEAARTAKQDLAHGLFDSGLFALSENRVLEAESFFAKSLTFDDRSETREQILAARSHGVRYSWLEKPNGRLTDDPQKGPALLGMNSDGTLAFIGQADSPVRIWDTRQRRFVADTPQHRGGTRVAAISNDGTWVAWDRSRTTDQSVPVGTLFLWNRETNEEFSFDADDRPIASVAFSSAAPIVAFANERGTIRLWNTEVKQEREPPLVGHILGVWALAFSPDGKWLASAGTGNDLRLWNLQQRQRNGGTHLVGHNDTVSSLAFSPDGSVLASGAADSTVRFWDLKHPGAILATLPVQGGASMALIYSADGRYLASGEEDQSVQVWDISNITAARAMLRLRSYEGQIFRLAFDDEGRGLVAAGRENWIRRWDIDNRTEVTTLHNFGNPTSSVAFLPDGKSLASASYDGKVRIWDIASASPKMTLSGSSKKLYCIAADAKRPLLAWGGEDNALHVWDLSAEKLAHPLLDYHDPARGDQDSGTIWGVAFNADGDQVACGNFNRTIHVYDLPSFVESNSFQQLDDGAVYAVCFDKSGRFIASGGGDRRARLWDLKDKKLKRAFDEQAGEVLGIAFSSDGNRIASGATNRTIQVWPVVGTDRYPPLTGHTGFISSVSFSPSERWLASASSDQTVRLWDRPAWASSPSRIDPKRVVVLRKATAPVEWVTFSPNGSKMACCDLSGEIDVWNVDVIESILADTPDQLVAQSLIDTGLRINEREISPVNK